VWQKLKKRNQEMVNILGNLNLNLDILYKKSDLPALSLGDTVKVTIYLELPKPVEEGEKKRERAYSSL
jgi:hypothetical protein